jgi:hypothetical protein
VMGAQQGPDQLRLKRGPLIYVYSEGLTSSAEYWDSDWKSMPLHSHANTTSYIHVPRQQEVLTSKTQPCVLHVTHPLKSCACLW